MKNIELKNKKFILGYANQKDLFKLYSRNASLQMAENFACFCVADLKKIMGVEFSQLIINNNEFVDVYSSEKEHVLVNEIILKKLKQAKTIKDFYEDKALPIFDEYMRFTKRMQSKYSNKNKKYPDLLRDYTEFIRINAAFIGVSFYIFLTDLVLEGLLKKYLNNYLKKINQYEDLQKYLELISTPIKKPAVMREHEALLVIVNNNKGNYKRLLKIHEKQWSWFPCYNPSDEPYKFAHYLEEFKKYNRESAKRELNKIKLERRRHQFEYKKLVKTIKDKNLKRLIPLTNMVCFYREHRNDLRREGLSYIRPLFERISEKFDLNVKEICYLNSNEIKNSLAKNKLVISPKLINKRIQQYILFGNIKKNILIENKKAIEEILAVIKNKNEVASIITGQTASVGKGQGRVMVVSNIEKLKKFKTGGILVASMTAPDYVSAMKKAAAIITDEGGITCHAAIISRELGIPCIIGTKIATKVLKDGDLVEVDADKGVVKII